MKRKNILWSSVVLFFCLLVVSPHQALAAPALTLGDILHGTESYYQHLSAFTAYFSQWTTSATASSMTTEASGKFYYQKPRQMRWQYQTPEPQVFIANRDIAWLYVPSEKQVSILDAKTFFSSPLAQTFFNGVDELQAHFNVSLDTNRSNSDTAVLRLVPKHEDPNIKLLLLWINLQNFQITQVETQDALANTNLIALREQQAVSHLDSNLFQLNIPQGTVVVDSQGRQLTPQQIRTLKKKY